MVLRFRKAYYSFFYVTNCKEQIKYIHDKTNYSQGIHNTRTLVCNFVDIPFLRYANNEAIENTSILRKFLL